MLRRDDRAYAPFSAVCRPPLASPCCFSLCPGHLEHGLLEQEGGIERSSLGPVAEGGRLGRHLETALPATDRRRWHGADAMPDVSVPGPLEGTNFIDQAKELYRVAACGGDDAVDAKFDAAIVDAHCKELRALMDDYKANWVNVAMPYIAELVPKELPPKVVYPFGGGDLLSALATFPDMPEYTTISLESAGDARKIDSITAKKLKAELALNRVHLGKLFEKAHSRTINLDLESKSDLPGEIIFTMVALVVHGYEPVALRYFRFNPDGTLHYLDNDEIAKAEKEKAAKSKSKTQAELEIFADMELQFRKKGDPAAPVRVLRHVAFNLDDAHMTANPSLLKHLEAKGRITAMTKAASHFLWSDGFSIIRNYLLSHMEWMISRLDRCAAQVQRPKPASCRTRTGSWSGRQRSGPWTTGTREGSPEALQNESAEGRPLPLRIPPIATTTGTSSSSRADP